MSLQFCWHSRILSVRHLINLWISFTYLFFTGGPRELLPTYIPRKKKSGSFHHLLLPPSQMQTECFTWARIIPPQLVCLMQTLMKACSGHAATQRLVCTVVFFTFDLLIYPTCWMPSQLFCWTLSLFLQQRLGTCLCIYFTAFGFWCNVMLIPVLFSELI